MRTSLASLFLSILFSASALAQQDAEGCKDHPLFTRLSNFYIEACQENFNAVDFQIGANGKVKAVEGNVTTLTYTFNAESGKKMPSPLQIIRNYDNALTSKGAKKLYQGVDDVDGGPMSAVFSLAAGGSETWVAVRKMYEPTVTGEVGSFVLIAMAKEAMKQEVQANEMFKEIASSGSIALYINFETGKADIKPESQNIVVQLAKMLQENPGLKVSIDGHTDNIGAAPSNLALSEKRAKSVLNAVIAKGVNGNRLSAKGWGQSKPVMDNNTEEGRAKNRRVEIVKM